MSAPDPADAALWSLAYIDAMHAGDEAGAAVLVESIGAELAIERLAGAAAGALLMVAGALGLTYAEYSAAARRAFLRADAS